MAPTAGQVVPGIGVACVPARLMAGDEMALVARQQQIISRIKTKRQVGLEQVSIRGSPPMDITIPRLNQHLPQQQSFQQIW